jgi:putative copper export protein
VNMLHTAAIVTWMGGLICVVFIVAPAGNASRALDVFNRFGKVAEKSMAVIIVTGVVQSARLHGGVVSIFTTPHGQLLVAKLLVFIFIVWLAARNRRVLFTSAGDMVDRPAVTRREIVMASLIEVGLGIVVLLVTAALVAASLS